MQCGQTEMELGANDLPAVLWKPLPLRLTEPALATGRRVKNAQPGKSWEQTLIDVHLIV